MEKYNGSLTPSSAFYACDGPKDQQERDLRNIITDLVNFPGEWGMTDDEEYALLDEARSYLEELLA
jgi:hypothetical protein